MLPCGISRAITGAFNAPLAATVFVFEVMLRRYTLPVLALVAIAATSAFLVNQAFFDHRFFALDCPSTAYAGRGSGSTYGTSVRSSSMVLYLWLQKLQRWSSNTTLSPRVTIAACALACALIGSLLPELLGRSPNHRGHVVR